LDHTKDGTEPNCGHSQPAICAALSLDLATLELSKLALKRSALRLEGSYLQFLKLLAWCDARLIFAPSRAVSVFPYDSFSRVVAVDRCGFEKLLGEVSDTRETSKLPLLLSVRVARDKLGIRGELLALVWFNLSEDRVSARAARLRRLRAPREVSTSPAAAFSRSRHSLSLSARIDLPVFYA
jgi:hypothetical protein